jgi:hypothetical protein
LYFIRLGFNVSFIKQSAILHPSQYYILIGKL